MKSELPQKGTAWRSRNPFGVRGLVRAFGRRLVAVERGKASDFSGPLDAALLWRQVAKAAKAVTSHRTPNSCWLCAKFHHFSMEGTEGEQTFLSCAFLRLHFRIVRPAARFYSDRA